MSGRDWAEEKVNEIRQTFLLDEWEDDTAFREATLAALREAEEKGTAHGRALEWAEPHSGYAEAREQAAKVARTYLGESDASVHDGYQIATAIRSMKPAGGTE